MSGTQSGQRVLRLFVPDWSELDTLRKSPLPFGLWPVGPQPLLHHWMDWAVRSQFTHVEIRTADRPAEIRENLDGGHYWSRPVTVLSAQSDASPLERETVVTGLPGMKGAVPESPHDLIHHWWKLNQSWLQAFPPDGPRLEAEVAERCWAGPRSRIHPSAELRGPVWLGAGVEIGPRCRIGPGVLIGRRSVIDADVEMSESLLLADGYAGSHIGLERKIADGGILLDVERGVRVDIAENFILSRPSGSEPPPGAFSRGLAALGLVLLALPALVRRGIGQRREGILLPSGDQVELVTGTQGPLIFRRWSWLWQVVTGRMHWFGTLPRTASDLEHVPEETAERIRASRVGVFSLADAHGVHDPQDENEWVHAAYQALGDPREVRRLLMKKGFQLWFQTPKNNP